MALSLGVYKSSLRCYLILSFKKCRSLKIHHNQVLLCSCFVLFLKATKAMWFYWYLLLQFWDLSPWLFAVGSNGWMNTGVLQFRVFPSILSNSFICDPLINLYKKKQFCLQFWFSSWNLGVFWVPCSLGKNRKCWNKTQGDLILKSQNWDTESLSMATLTVGVWMEHLPLCA